MFGAGVTIDAIEFTDDGSEGHRLLKKDCPASALETPCFSFFRAFLASQSNPAIASRSIMSVYDDHIRQ
ncbi:MAG: hypothetical protein U1E86_04555 [Burkholderiaceae bacterium]